MKGGDQGYIMDVLTGNGTPKFLSICKDLIVPCMCPFRSIPGAAPPLTGLVELDSTGRLPVHHCSTPQLVYLVLLAMNKAGSHLRSEQTAELPSTLPSHDIPIVVTQC